MQETLQDFNTTVSVGGRPFCYLRLADDTPREAARMNFKSSRPDWKKRQELMGWKSAKRNAKYLSIVPARTPHYDERSEP